MASAPQTFYPDLAHYEAAMVACCLLLLLWLAYRQATESGIKFALPVEGLESDPTMLSRFVENSHTGSEGAANPLDPHAGKYGWAVNDRKKAGFSGMFEQPAFWEPTDMATRDEINTVLRTADALEGAAGVRVSGSKKVYPGDDLMNALHSQ